MNYIFSKKENRYIGRTDAKLSIGETVRHDKVSYRVTDILRGSEEYGMYHDLPRWCISDIKTYVLDEM